LLIIAALPAKIFEMPLSRLARPFSAWSKQSAYLRGQILYRAAEMLEMRRLELQTELERANQSAARKASEETALAVDRLVHYAGWTDKFSEIFSSVNPGHELAF
jgi:acyl-CoA reductase-like NAD-dependent aldehyde dehydrogenase